MSWVVRLVHDMGQVIVPTNAIWFAMRLCAKLALENTSWGHMFELFVTLPSATFNDYIQTWNPSFLCQNAEIPTPNMSLNFKQGIQLPRSGFRRGLQMTTGGPRRKIQMIWSTCPGTWEEWRASGYQFRRLFLRVLLESWILLLLDCILVFKVTSDVRSCATPHPKKNWVDVLEVSWLGLRPPMPTRRPKLASHMSRR